MLRHGFLLAGAITALTSVRVTFAATAVGVLLASVWMAALLRGTAAESAESPAASLALAGETS